MVGENEGHVESPPRDRCALHATFGATFLIEENCPKEVLMQWRVTWMNPTTSVSEGGALFDGVADSERDTTAVDVNRNRIQVVDGV